MPNHAEDPSFLSPARAFARLGIGPTLGWRLIRTGEIPSVKIGGARRVPVEAVEAFVRRAMEPTAPVNPPAPLELAR